MPVLPRLPGSIATWAPGRRLPLALIATAQLIVALDATIVNVALPSAQRALGFDDAHRAWMVTAYTVAFAGLLLLGGRLVDRYGSRRSLQTALLGFAAASALAGTAPGLGVLVTGRALQGAFAAVLSPAALAMIAGTYTEPGERGRAFGVYGAVASSGAVVGLLAGGLLTEAVGWRWCLYVNVVVCVAAFLLGRVVFPHTPAPQSGGRLDVASAALGTSALAAVVLGCARAAHVGWSAWPVFVSWGAGVALAVAFTLRQRNVSSPLLPPGLFQERARVAAYLAAATGVVGMFGTFLMLTYNFQRVLGLTPLQTGVAFVPMTLAVALSSYGFAGRVMSRVGPWRLVVPGLVVSAAGLLLLATLDPSSGYVTTIVPGEVLAGAGMGCVTTPAIAAATADVAPSQAGAAAAGVNVAMQVGASVGTAALNTVAVQATSDSSAAGVAAQVAGYATATGWAAGLLLLAALIVTVIVRLGFDAWSAMEGDR